MGGRPRAVGREEAELRCTDVRFAFGIDLRHPRALGTRQLPLDVERRKVLTRITPSGPNTSCLVRLPPIKQLQNGAAVTASATPVLGQLASIGRAPNRR
jgi:hypothetical protein